MTNKSCRSCGEYLSSISECTVCKEYIFWICVKCERMEDVTHIHSCLQVESRHPRAADVTK